VSASVRAVAARRGLRSESGQGKLSGCPEKFPANPDCAMLPSRHRLQIPLAKKAGGCSIGASDKNKRPEI